MPRRDVPLVAGEYYHVYNRGNNRQPIFFERENYLFFLKRVRERLLEDQNPAAAPNPGASEVRQFCTLVAYCLMPNHYHLLVCPADDHLSRHMRRFSISYTKAINRGYDRVGALFQGPFQALHVDRNEYLLHLSRYIHLNPVEAGLVKRAQDWEFSSYREYAGLRHGTLPRPDVILSQFSNRDTYPQFVESFQPAGKNIISHLLFADDSTQKSDFSSNSGCQHRISRRTQPCVTFIHRKENTNEPSSNQRLCLWHLPDLSGPGVPDHSQLHPAHLWRAHHRRGLDPHHGHAVVNPGLL